MGTENTENDAPSQVALRDLREQRYQSALVAGDDPSRWTLKAVAARAGMTSSYLSNIEAGVRAPSKPDVVARLAEALEVDIDVVTGLLQKEMGLSGIHRFLRDNPGMLKIVAIAAENAFGTPEILLLLQEAKTLVPRRRMRAAVARAEAAAVPPGLKTAPAAKPVSKWTLPKRGRPRKQDAPPKEQDANADLMPWDGSEDR